MTYKEFCLAIGRGEIINKIAPNGTKYYFTRWDNVMTVVRIEHFDNEGIPFALFTNTICMSLAFRLFYIIDKTRTV